MTDMRLLYLDILAPMPDRHASSVRTHQLLTLLRARGIAIDFAPLHPPEHKGQAELMHAMGITPLPWLDEPERVSFLERHAREYDTIVCAWTTVARRFLRPARQAAPDAFLIFDSHDVNHVREYREARVTNNQNTVRRAFTSRARERDALTVADCTLAITETDRSLLHALAPEAHLEVVTMWWEPAAQPPALSSSDVVFVGHYGAPHNHDAAIHLARDVWPLVRQHAPGARLVLAGSDPDAEINSLAAADILVPGWIADLAPLLAQARVFVAPLRFGSGIKGKVLQAMACGVPIVASAVAAEGIGLVDGADYCRAESAEATAQGIVKLLADRDLSHSLAKGASAVLQQHHSRAAVAAQLDRVLALTGRKPELQP